MEAAVTIEATETQLSSVKVVFDMVAVAVVVDVGPSAAVVLAAVEINRTVAAPKCGMGLLLYTLGGLGGKDCAAVPAAAAGVDIG